MARRSSEPSERDQLPYFCNCVNWRRDDVEAEGGLVDMIDQGLEISRRTFLGHIDRAGLAELEADLGYAGHPRQGLTMAGDYHVRYFRSRLHGARCYYFVHSAIEFVFADAVD